MAASSTTPSTPEPRPKGTGVRSVTMPSNVASLSSSSSPVQTETTPSAQGVETLFVHPSCTIIKFSTSAVLSGSPSKGNTRGLQWASPTERTVAAGSLQIYRVPETVSFLRSGELLHAIMPRSQCWCVDGISKFALRVFADTYYRIELPGNTQEELEAVEDFKAVLGKVMLYERTSCPFARNTAEEELPELEDSRNKTFSRSDKAKQWQLDRTFSWKGENGAAVQLRPAGITPPRQKLSHTVSSPARPSEAQSPLSLSVSQVGLVKPQAESPSTHGVDSLISEQITGGDGEKADQQCKRMSEFVAAAASEQSLESQPKCFTAAQVSDAGDDLVSISTELEELDTQRSLDVATVQNLVDPFTDSADQTPVYDRAILNEDAEPQHAEGSSSLLQFHSIQEIPTDMPPSPPDSSAGFPLPDDSIDCPAEDETELHVPADEQAPPHHDHMSTASSRTLSSPRDAGAYASASLTAASKPSPDDGSAQEDPFVAIQARILARRSIGGTTTFYPSVTRENTSCSTASASSSVSSRSRISVISQQKNLASALVQKACSVFLGPPAYLVAIMLRIAARFANGKMGGLLNLDGGESIDDGVPGSFHVRGHSHASEEDEDDFGISLNSPIRVAAAKNLRERRNREQRDLD